MGRVTRCEGRIGRDRISVRIVAPPQTHRGPARGTVLVPPLIGGSGFQQVGYFRELGTLGYRLATFDYRGHGKSGGRFCIQHTIEDAHVALEVVLRSVGGPMFGVADCYGCVPLLRAAAHRPEAFRALALFNPIPSLQFVAGPRQILSSYFRPGGRFAWRNPFDLLGMLAATNEVLFPHVDKSRRHFGILDYERAHFRRALREYLFLQPLRGVRVDLPALVGYGRTDTVLGLSDPEAEARYRALWSRHLVRAEVCALEDVDHYWTGAQARASHLAAGLFERALERGTVAEPDLAIRPPATRARGRVPSGTPQREPGDAPERNHQLTGRITSSGL